MKHFVPGDIIFPIRPEAGSPRFGYCVTRVMHDEQLVMVDGTWVPMADYRWAGSIELLRSRIIWQMQFSKRLLLRKFYSEARKQEVIQSALIIQRKLQDALEYFTINHHPYVI